ncbi:MAG: hypothetical protein WCG05_00190 [Alphaproteobacteria bacterium]
MKKVIFYLKGFFILLLLASKVSASMRVSTLNTSANEDAIQKISDKQKTQASPSASKYTLSVSETWLKNKNHFAALKGRTMGNISSVALNAKESATWDWGVAALLMKNKINTFANNGVENTTSNGIVPYAVYKLNPNISFNVLGGAITSRLRISEIDNNKLGAGVARSNAGFFETGVTTKKTFGRFTPSLHASILYYNSKTGRYNLSNGTNTSAEWSHLMQGRIGARLDMRLDPFSLYAKSASEVLLRRSSNYIIQDWNGWSATGGFIYFLSPTWNVSGEYKYHRLPIGARQSSILLRLNMRY